MPKITLLPENVAELIAAGEVVERPASVIKELVENSVDAGATAITVEIQRGGITYIRVTDNGCGIAFEDVPTAFLRHATSKIKKSIDLDSISTLGFRGEALAAVASVARVEMLTATEDSEFGTSYAIEGGKQIKYEECGFTKGTTIIIRDIFYNTPARMKFLKKDVSEANACSAVLERIALSHPEISFKLIRDGKATLSTSGDGSIRSAVYSVLGREFSASLIDVDFESNLGIKVNGLTCKPITCRPTRNNQYTFLNGRLVRSGTVVAAVEQAYKNSSMVGKFPGFVLYLNVPYNSVDVNVHPAKTEVRFSNEKSIFDAVYVSIKNSLSNSDTRPEIKLNKKPFNPFEHISTDQYRQEKMVVSDDNTVIEKAYKNPISTQKNSFNNHSVMKNDNIPSFMNNFSLADEKGEKVNHIIKEQFIESPITKIDDFSAKETVASNNTANKKVDVDIAYDKKEDEIKLIGEAFSTYIIVEKGSSIFLIDKHAAHERIIFNNLKKNHNIQIQPLLMPVSVSLDTIEYDAVISNLNLLEQAGFEIEEFGNKTVLVRAIPSYLTSENVSLIISEIANGLIVNKSVSTEREDHLFHTVSCKAAIKAGSNISDIEKLELARKVLEDKEILYCPHGRPVSFEIKKRELEKRFGRIQ